MTIVFGRVFWQSMAEQVIGFSAAGAAAVLAPHAGDLLGSVPWSHVASGAVIGALLGALTAFGSLKVRNGTASFNRNVVAAQSD